MKRILIALFALLLALLPVIAMAVKSRGNQDIPETTVKEVVPEDETEEVIPPVVDIVPDTPEIIELQETLKTVFRLTISYVYVDGSPAAPAYDVTLQGGTEYSIPSPSVKDFTASKQTVGGVMPMRDIEYSVVYLSAEEEIPEFPYSEMPELFTLDDYEAPTGLGFSVANVGICFE